MRLLFFCFAVGLALFGTANADPLLDGIAKIPGPVEDVRIGGTWEKDGKNGEYRVVIARSGGDSVTARLLRTVDRLSRRRRHQRRRSGSRSRSSVRSRSTLSTYTY